MSVLIKIQDAFTPLLLRYFYMDMNCFRTGSCSFELVAGGLGGGG